MSRRRREGGVTVVEAALALPILFVFVLGLLDLGMWTLNENQATNAAKDGARGGIITYEQADVDNSADQNAIIDRIESSLPGREITSIDVRCIEPDGGDRPGGCAAARPDVDRLEVTVDWTWKLLTPIAGLIGVDEGVASGTAVMSIIGQPLGSPPSVDPPDPPAPEEPPEEPDPVVDCAISNLQVTPDPAARKNKNGQLNSDLTVTYDTNQADRCNGLAVQFTTPSPSADVLSAICRDCEVDDPSHEWTYSKNEKSWSDAGQATVRVFNEYIDVTGTFQVTGSF